MMETVVASSALITAIIAIRFLVKGKTSAKLRYALWSLVLLRLLLPFPLWASPISVMNGAELGRNQSPAQAVAWNPKGEAAAEMELPATGAAEPAGTSERKKPSIKKKSTEGPLCPFRCFGNPMRRKPI